MDSGQNTRKRNTLILKFRVNRRWEVEFRREWILPSLTRKCLSREQLSRWKSRKNAIFVQNEPLHRQIQKKSRPLQSNSSFVRPVDRILKMERHRLRLGAHYCRTKRYKLLLVMSSKMGPVWPNGEPGKRCPPCLPEFHAARLVKLQTYGNRLRIWSGIQCFDGPPL